MMQEKCSFPIQTCTSRINHELAGRLERRPSCASARRSAHNERAMVLIAVLAAMPMFVPPRHAKGT